MTADQVAGMNLFFGKAKCAKMPQWAVSELCSFALGMADMQQGVLAPLILHLETPKAKDAVVLQARAADLYKFKVPQLYNLKDAGFYGHGGNFTSIEQVIRYINTAVPQNANVLATQLLNNLCL